MAILPVLLPLPFDQPFDYRSDVVECATPGSFVRVPFGPRQVIGVIWDEAPERRSPPEKLKSILDQFDLPPMPLAIRHLIRETSRETLMPLGNVLRLAMSVPAAFDAKSGKVALVRAPDLDLNALSAKRRNVIEAADPGTPLATAELARRAEVNASLIRNMVGDGNLLRVEVPENWHDAEGLEFRAVTLSPAQAQMADIFKAAVRTSAFQSLLLEGVPGSGKTEVYFEAIAAALEMGKRALVLLPEIALSAQWLSRFRERFGGDPLVWHSGITGAQRRRNWLRIAHGGAQVVVGARSALFLPLTDLGVVVVDEEHDPSFKQEDGTLYHARDVAISRARIEVCPVILASATPSLETALKAGAVAGYNQATVETKYCSLPARHGGARMPVVDLVDLRRDRPARGRFLSEALKVAVQRTLALGEQSILFLNRRGYAPLTICRACGFRFCCPNCSAWMIEHRFRERLICHHCGYVRPTPEFCTECGALESLIGSGPGVERIAEEVAALFPDAKIAVMASDTVRSAAAATELVSSMQHDEIDILVGTQILAKGHHFPNLTLVGVVDADVGLTGGDLRAGERCFQLLYQVAGRAGRETKPGQVLIQTHMPEHPVMQALKSGDRDGFLRVECEERRQGGMPPFGRLAALILAGADGELVKQTGRRLAAAAPHDDNVRILGPAPAPLSLLRGRYRVRLLAKAHVEVDLPTWVRAWLAHVRIPSKVQLQIDMDPVSFL